jgi:dTDP-4-dehydrorhamnose 3,5-epimerase
MEAIRLDLPGVVQITPRRFVDERGFLAETYSERGLAQIGIEVPFVQDNHSLSRRAGTIRGLHFQTPPHAQAKLVRVISGAILDVALDLRHGSPGFGKHVAVTLSAATGTQLFVPEGFAHGFCTLEPDTQVIYKLSRPYRAASDAGVFWNDPALGIAWPVDASAAILSDKDLTLPLLADLPAYFRFSG